MQRLLLVFACALLWCVLFLLIWCLWVNMTEMSWFPWVAASCAALTLCLIRGLQHASQFFMSMPVSPCACQLIHRKHPDLLNTHHQPILIYLCPMHELAYLVWVHLLTELRVAIFCQQQRWDSNCLPQAMPWTWAFSWDALLLLTIWCQQLAVLTSRC